MKKLYTALCVAGLAVVVPLGAQVPERINYQGRLSSDTGLVQGSTQLVFRLYTEPTAGTPLYTETQQVMVADGLYAVQVGASNALPGSLFAAVTNTPLYLEVSVGPVAMEPRERVAAVSYAMMAAALPSGAVTSGMLGDGSVTDAAIATNAMIQASKVDVSGIDHGSIAGLSDDDHTQYLERDGSDTMAGSLEPASDLAYSLGGAGAGWSDLHLGGTVYHVSDLYFVSGTATSATLAAGGKLGVGARTPEGMLHLAYTGSVSAIPYMLVTRGSSAQTQLVFSAGDDLGIGHGEPAAKVDIKYNGSEDALQVWSGISPQRPDLLVNGEGKIGIGTNDPQATLHVVNGVGSGSFRVDGSFGSDLPALYVDSQVGIHNQNPSGALHISRRFVGEDPLVVEDEAFGSDATPFVIKSFGHVGILTNWPHEALTVNGKVWAKALVSAELTQTNAGQALIIDVAGGDAAGEDLVIIADNFSVDAGGAVRASSFSGDAGSLTNIDAETVGGIDALSFLRSDTTDVWNASQGYNTLYFRSVSNAYHMKIIGGGEGAVTIGRSQFGGSDAMLEVSENGNDDILRLYTNNYTVLVVDNDGQMGIGIISPDANLTIDGEVGELLFKVNNPTYPSLETVIDDKGYLGVGTEMPSNWVHVKVGSSSLVAQRIENAFGGTGSDAGLILDTLFNTFILGIDKSDEKFKLVRGDDLGGSDVVLSVDTNSRVGIGTANPVAALHVSGDLHLSGSTRDLSIPNGQTLQIGHWDGATFTQRMAMDGNGRLGIGRPNPFQQLEVIGDAFVGGGVGLGPHDGDSEFLGIRAQTNTWILGVQNEADIEASDFFIGRDATEDGTFHIQEGNGSVGIGTSEPEGRLHVAATSSTNVPLFEAASQVINGLRETLRLKATKNTDMSDGFGPYMSLIAEDNAGSPQTLALIGALRDNGDDGDGTMVIYTSENGGLGERMRIESDGTVGIGTPSPSFLLTVDGSAGKPGGGSWSVFSDARLKTSVTNLQEGLDTLMQLRPVVYEYRDAEVPGYLPGRQVGFIAQEVEKVIPDWVEEKDGYKVLSVRGFEALSVSAMQELQQENAALKSRLDELEKRLNALE